MIHRQSVIVMKPGSADSGGILFSRTATFKLWRIMAEQKIITPGYIDRAYKLMDYYEVDTEVAEFIIELLEDVNFLRQSNMELRMENIKLKKGMK